MKSLAAILALCLTTGCTAPLVSKNYGAVTYIATSNMQWTVEVKIEKDYNAELKGSLK